MKNLFFITLLLFAFTSFIKAQDYSLKFSRAITVSGSEMTVPAGKVWKVTAVTGQEFTPQACLNISDNTTDAIGKYFVDFYNSGSWPNNSTRVSYFITELVINGVRVPFRMSGLKSSNSIYYASTNCTGNTNNGYDFTSINMTSDPNVLPQWLAAGTTLKTGGPNTIASVLEFSLIP